MKRLLKGFLLLCAAAALTACGAKPEAASSVATVLPESASSSAFTAPAPEHSVQLPESSTAGASDIHTGMDADIDLTLLSDTVVNAEVYNMLVTPENYTDKIVRMTGEYQEYTDERIADKGIVPVKDQLFQHVHTAPPFPAANSRPCGLCRYASRVPKKIVSPT